MMRALCILFFLAIQLIPPCTHAAETPALSEAEIKKYASQLSDEDFVVRERATQMLQTAGQEAIPFLKELLKASDPELKARATQLLAALTFSGPTVNGLSLRLEVSAPEVTYGEYVTFTLQYLNQTDSPMLVMVGYRTFSGTMCLQKMDGKEAKTLKLDAAFPTAKDTVQASGACYAEIQPHQSLVRTLKIKVRTELPPEMAGQTAISVPSDELDFLPLAAGQTYSLRSITFKKCLTEPQNTESFTSYRGKTFKSNAKCWTGQAVSNEVQLTIKEK